MKGKYIINTLKKKEAKEGITLICTFSRRIMVPMFFKVLEQMDLPRKDMHLLIYDNTQDVLLEKALMEALSPIRYQYRSIRLYKSYLKGRGNITGSGNEMFKESILYNIWVMWKRLFVSSPKMIFTPTFFMLEDDTIAPPNAFKRLYKTLLRDDNTAIVTGIATGRSPYPWTPARLGVHYINMKGFKLISRNSLHPDTKGIVDIDCCGVYCYVARTELFLKGFEGYDPYIQNIPFFAMDNVLTWNIKRKGYKVLADFRIWCSHLQCSSARIISFGKDQALEMADLWIPKFNNYAQGVEIIPKGSKVRRFRVRKRAESWEI